MRLRHRMSAAFVCALVPWSALQAAQIEEVIVTAEKREATVSDTSISITAFDSTMLEELGFQGPDDLVNYTPATTRDAYDIRIRGVGRNFRALGGDPGIATYYNGVYSEDFGIASTENALYDVQRIEVLRGPQGTLYGRNAIGGALNYISNQPTMDWTGEARTQIGNFGAREFYGVVSGPILADQLAFRLTGIKLDRDGSQDGYGGSEDVNSIDDRNVAIALQWIPTESIQANLRFNDRRSDRIIGTSALINEGPAGARGVRDTTNYARGLRRLAGPAPGALEFTNPLTDATVYGAFLRPGVDSSIYFPWQPNGAYLSPVARLNSGGGETEDVDHEALTNGMNDEVFEHNSVAFDVAWDTSIGTFKYIYGYSDFEYTFDIDNDFSNEFFSQYRQTVLEDVYTYSHELQYLWEIGDRITGTSGLYNFYSRRRQNYGLANQTAQGRYTEPMNYGTLALLPPQFGPIIPAIYGPHRKLGDAAPFQSIIGVWGGEPDGYQYRHDNELLNTSYAAYTQVVYDFNETWALTLGIRWAEDEKEADEQRFVYFEDPFTFTGYLAGLMPFFGGSATNTPLANANILWGAATLNPDPAVQINPVCGLKDPCNRPLRLGGIPFSNATRTLDDDSWSEVTWRANLDWTPDEDTLVYLSATTGYRAGGYSLGVASARDFARDENGAVISTSVLAPPFQYDKETVISYEVGYKDLFFDRRLQLFASMYLYQYEDYQDQVDAFDVVRSSSVDVVQNAPEAENFGFEIETTWLPTDAITIGFNYSYANTEYSKDYFVTSIEDPSLPVSLFGPVATNQDLFVVNVKGNELKRIPEHKGTVWGAYRWVTDFGNVTANATVAYTGEYYSTALNTDLDKVPDRTQVDMSLIWTNRSEKIRVRAFVDNVFDEGYLRGLDMFGEGSNWAQTGEYLYPRFYGLDIRMAFGG